MNFEMVDNKQLGLIERLSSELLEALRRVKFNQEIVYKELTLLNEIARKERQDRFDLNDQVHKGY